MKTIIKSISSNPHFMLNKNLVKTIGITETLLLQHFIEFQFNVFGGKEFYQQQERICDELNISLRQVKQIISKLINLNLLNCKKKGTPAKNYYSINEEEVIKIIQGKTTSTEVKKPKTTKVKEIIPMIDNNKNITSNEVKSIEVINTTPTDTNVSNNEDKDEYSTFEINTGTIKVINSDKLKFIVESGYNHIIKKIRNTKSEFMANVIIDEEYDKVIERQELLQL